jgi:histidyl-tRNA synthetase
MTEREMFPQALVSSPADLMVTVWSDETITESISLATQLRREGLRVDLYPEMDKLARQFKYAAARGIPFVVIAGDDERARGEVSVKDLRSGHQRSIRRESLASYLRESL